MPRIEITPIYVNDPRQIDHDVQYIGSALSGIVDHRLIVTPLMTAINDLRHARTVCGLRTRKGWQWITIEDAENPPTCLGCADDH